MSGAAGYSYVFGRYRLSIIGEEIKVYSDDHPQQLNPQLARALRKLIENHGQFVKKEDLLKYIRVADDADDSTLPKIIRELRLFLNDFSEEGRLIKTERGRGYSFAGKVEMPPGEISAKDSRQPRPSVEVEAERQQHTADNQVGGQSGDAAARPEQPRTAVAHEGMDTFEQWLTSPGKLITLIFIGCVMLTMALSLTGILKAWPYTNLSASIAQTIVLFVALLYPLRGPKRFKKEGVRLHEDIKALGYDDPDEWNDASALAESALGRYKIYWRGILFTWFLLYSCLTITGLPDLNWNCQRDVSRFCVGSLKDPTDLLVQLQDEQNPRSKYLREQFSPEMQRSLKTYDRSVPPSKSLQLALVDELNQRLNDCYLSDDQRFDGVALPEGTRNSIGKKPQGQALVNFNRSLLEAAYSISTQDISARRFSFALSILTTLFNNCSSLMIILCFNVLNKPTEIKEGKPSISDTSLSVGAAAVLGFTLIEVLLVMIPTHIENYNILKWSGWASGIAGGIAMALYVGRLQSKFLGPRAWLLIALYSYTAIQSLFVFLEEHQVAAVLLIDVALFLKCLLFLYMAWLFQSGRLLFYFMLVRLAYKEVNRKWEVFPKVLDEKS